MNLKKSYARNICLYKYYIVFSGALLIWPIEILFMQEKGLSYTEIMLIESLASVMQLILEIPSGMVADKIGCKKTVLSGLLCEIFAYVVLIFANGFEVCVAYSIFLALGYSLISGAETALIYESHLEIKRKDDYMKTIRKSGFWKMIVLSFVTIASGILYTKNIYLPHIISIVFLGISVCIIAMYKEVNTKSNEIERQNVRCMIKSVIHVFSKNKELCWLVTVAILFNLIFADSNYFLQIYMKEVNLGVGFYGAVFFVCNMVSAFSFKNSERIISFLGNRTKIVSVINLALIYAVSGVLYNFIGIGILCFTRIWIATIKPLLNTSINEKLPSASRATLLSIYAALVSIFLAIFDPIMGLVMDVYGIRGAFIGIVGICMILIFILTGEKKLCEARKCSM